jgi:hypothetical protein
VRDVLVCVVEVGDCHCNSLVLIFGEFFEIWVKTQRERDIPSQWCTQR